MRIIAIIPARGGSKGLPRKNLRPLNGVPLLARAIRAAHDAKHVADVYVTSDDDEILALAESEGAQAIRRPDDISGARATSESALLHALAEIERSEPNAEEPVEAIAFLQCTSPFTTGEAIDAVVAPVLSGDCDSALAVREDHGFLWKVDARQEANCIQHDKADQRPRRQDLDPQYLETGAIYAMRAETFQQSGNRFCGRTKVVPLDLPSVEIDTSDDWAMAEAMAATMDSAIMDSKASRIPQDLSIKALIMDFDGVHTDDQVMLTSDGMEIVRCHRGDGMGIEKLRNLGLKMLILSREANPVVRARADKLKLEVRHHVLDKLPNLDQWRADQGLEWQDIAYIGNDTNDVECMSACGFSAAPADAHPSAKAVADLVLAKGGGKGALRELAELLIERDLLQLNNQ